MILGKKIILLSSIAITPILGSIFGYGYEHTKVLFFILVMTLISVLYLDEILANFKQVKNFSLNIPAGIFILTLFITSLIGKDPLSSFLGREPYFQGIMLYIFLFIFYLIVSRAQLPIKYWAYAISISSLIVSVLAIKDYLVLNLLSLPVSTYAGRVVSTFGQPNFYGGFLLMGLPFLLFLTTQKEYFPRFLGWRIIALSITAILISGSRAAIALTTLLTLYFLMKHLRNLNKIIMIALILLIVTAALVASLYTKSGLVWKEVDLPNYNQWLINNSPEKRSYIWQIILKLITQRPFIGFGVENINSEYARFFKEVNFNLAQDPAYYSLRDLVIDRSHNYFLDILFYSGLVGLIVWILLVTMTLRKSNSGTLKLGLIIFIFYSLVQVLSIVHLIYFWMLVGLIEKQTFYNTA